MKNGTRENFIAIPIFIGLVIEFIIKCFLVGDETYKDTFPIDTQLKMALFVFSFYVFYAIVPKSKRLLIFMGAIIFSCTLNILFLYEPVYAVWYEELIYVTFNSMFNFNLIYRSIEVFIIFSWISGIKQNVGVIVDWFSNNDSSFSYRNKRRLQ